MAVHLAVEGLSYDKKQRIRRRHTALLQKNLQRVNQPVVKSAETCEEIEEALSLVYQEYRRLGYIKKAHGTKIYASIYHVLPQTTVLVCKVQHKIIGTLTQIFDSDVFGLPLDCLYHDELLSLRDMGRKIVEISALASCPESCSYNPFMYLFGVAYQNTKLWNTDDVCIMVNPKHVEFYKTILLFEDLGPERFYSRVGAPAVALRLNLNDHEERLRENYRSLGGSDNWYSFLCCRTNGASKDFCSLSPGILDENTVRHIFLEQTNIFEEAPLEQQNYIRAMYPGL